MRVLENMDEEVLKKISNHIEPRKYTKNSIIIREDEPLEMMLFIVAGGVILEKKDCSSNLQRGAGELYGERLLAWPSSNSFPELPLATESVMADGDVEALVLMASDMKNIGLEFRWKFQMHDKARQKWENHQGFIEKATKIFTDEELNKATNNYDESRILGKEDHGVIYKGILPAEQRVVVIKKYKAISETQMDNFVNEVFVLSQTNHKNIVRLLGCCFETEGPLMVFEYTCYGSLYDLIHAGDRFSLSLALRLKIAVETAGALSYLHYSTYVPIIHRDVKSTNILLDDNFTSKVSNFGASRLVPECQNKVSTAVQEMSGDVYSLGVVLIELLITSKAALSFGRSDAKRNLANFFLCSVEEGRLDQVLDPEIVNEGSFEMVEKLAYLTKRCLSFRAEERPSMKEVAVELEVFQNSVAEHSRKANLSRSSKDTDYFLGSTSNAFVVDVSSEDDGDYA